MEDADRYAPIADVSDSAIADLEEARAGLDSGSEEIKHVRAELQQFAHHNQPPPNPSQNRYDDNPHPPQAQRAPQPPQPPQALQAPQAPQVHQPPQVHPVPLRFAQRMFPPEAGDNRQPELQPHSAVPLLPLTFGQLRNIDPTGGNIWQTLGYLKSVGIYYGLPDLVRLAGEASRTLTPDSMSAVLRRIDNPNLLSLVVSVLNLPPVAYQQANLETASKLFGSTGNFFNSLRSMYELPSRTYCNDAHLLQLMNRQKVMYPHLRHVVIPKAYRELSVTSCFKKWFQYPFINIALPDFHPGDEPLPADYFFSLVNTAYPNSMQLLLNAIKRTRVAIPEITEDLEVPPHLAELFANAVRPIDAKYNKRSYLTCEPYRVEVTICGAQFVSQFPIT